MKKIRKLNSELPLLDKWYLNRAKERGWKLFSYGKVVKRFQKNGVVLGVRKERDGSLTVYTELLHPLYGYGQLFRGNVNNLEYIKILNNPREHLGIGFKLKTKNRTIVFK